MIPFEGSTTGSVATRRVGAFTRQDGDLTRRGFGLGLVAMPSLLGGLLPHPALALDLLTPDIKAIKDRGRLVVGFTSFDSPPFYYAPRLDGGGFGDLEGWDVQLAADLARVLDVPLVLDRKASSFNAVVDAVSTGIVDLAISKLSRTPRRAVTVRFTAPTIELRHALLVNRIALAKREKDGDARSVITPAFDGTIGVIASSSFAENARQVFPGATMREFAGWDAVVDAVNGGSVDLAYRDELEVKKIMRLRPELHLTLRSVLITDYRDAIAVAGAPASEQLLGVVNVLLAQRRRFDANQLLDQYPDVFKNV